MPTPPNPDSDPAFFADPAGLQQALKLLLSTPPASAAAVDSLSSGLPESGLGETATLDLLAPLILGGARRLNAPDALAHMDPPTPWIAWATTLWNAALNQNLLHPDIAPVARDVEARVVNWLAPYFGMDGGHMTPGSTVANLTAIWAAREVRGVRRVLASASSHLSIAKAAHLLGLEYMALPTDEQDRLTPETLPPDLADACLVLTAGTTSAGVIDPLEFAGRAAWTHVDAAWAGPLRLSDQHAAVLQGIENADSISVSAHKWFFQPKESALIFFRNTAEADPAISFGGAYLAVPNIGLLGSHGAVAVPLLATLLAWGRTGLAERIDRAMAVAQLLHERLSAHPKIEVFGPATTGVVLWKLATPEATTEVFERLPKGSISMTRLHDEAWLRNVAANPVVQFEALWKAILSVL